MSGGVGLLEGEQWSGVMSSHSGGVLSMLEAYVAQDHSSNQRHSQSHSDCSRLLHVVAVVCLCSDEGKATTLLRKY